MPDAYEIVRFGAPDRARWSELWRAYLDFYETSLPAELYERTWTSVASGAGPISGFAARDADGRLVGLTHYLFHPSGWTLTDLCYLQDLYVEPKARARGVARGLIEAVAAAARERGCARLYWTTHESNATARALYEKIAAYTGFVRYDYRL